MQALLLASFLLTTCSRQVDAVPNLLSSRCCFSQREGAPVLLQRDRPQGVRENRGPTRVHARQGARGGPGEGVLQVMHAVQLLFFSERFESERALSRRRQLQNALLKRSAADMSPHESPFRHRRPVPWTLLSPPARHPRRALLVAPSTHGGALPLRAAAADATPIRPFPPRPRLRSPAMSW